MLDGRLKTRVNNGRVYGVVTLDGPGGPILIRATETIVGADVASAVVSVVNQIMEAADFFPLRKLIGDESFAKAVNIYANLTKGDANQQKKAMNDLNLILKNSRQELDPTAQDIDYALARFTRLERDKKDNVSGDFVVDGFGWSPAKLRENIGAIARKSKPMKKAVTIHQALKSRSPATRAKAKMALKAIKRQSKEPYRGKRFGSSALTRKELEEKGVKVIPVSSTEEKPTQMIPASSTVMPVPISPAAFGPGSNPPLPPVTVPQDVDWEEGPDSLTNATLDDDYVETYDDGEVIDEVNGRAILAGIAQCIRADRASAVRTSLMGNEITTVGFSFKKLIKGIGKGLGKVAKVAMPFAKMIPGVGNVIQATETGLSTVKKASGLLKAAKELDPKAIKKIKKVKALAKAGVPAAVQAVAALKVAQNVQKEAEAQLVDAVGPPLDSSMKEVTRPIPVKIVEWA